MANKRKKLGIVGTVLGGAALLLYATGCSVVDSYIQARQEYEQSQKNLENTKEKYTKSLRNKIAEEEIGLDSNLRRFGVLVENRESTRTELEEQYDENSEAILKEWRDNTKALKKGYEEDSEAIKKKITEAEDLKDKYQTRKTEEIKKLEEELSDFMKNQPKNKSDKKPNQRK